VIEEYNSEQKLDVSFAIHRPKNTVEHALVSCCCCVGQITSNGAVVSFEDESSRVSGSRSRQRAFTICTKVFQFWKHFQLTNIAEREFNSDAVAVVVQIGGSLVEIGGERLLQPAVVKEEKSEPDVIVQTYDPREMEVTDEQFHQPSTVTEKGARQTVVEGSTGGGVSGEQPAVAIQAWEPTQVEVMGEDSHQHSILVGRGAVQTWEEEKVKSLIVKDIGEQEPDAVFQTSDSIQVEVTERGVVQTREGAQRKSLIRHPDNTLEPAVVSLCCGASRKPSAVRRPDNTVEHALVSCCCCGHQKTLECAAVSFDGGIPEGIGNSSCTRRAFTICTKVFQFWKHFQFTNVLERELTAHGTAMDDQTWKSTAAEINGEQLHQPVVGVEETMAMQAWESTEVQATYKESRQHSIPEEREAVQTWEETEFVRGGGIREQEADVVVRTYESMEVEVSDAQFHMEDIEGEEPDVVVQTFESIEVVVTDERICQSSTAMKRSAMRTREGAQGKSLISRPSNTLEHTLVSLCCGASQKPSAVRRPDNIIEHALVSWCCCAEDKHRIRRPDNTWEHGIVSLCCGASRRAKVRWPDNSFEHALVACCCCAGKKSLPVRNLAEGSARLGVVGEQQPASATEGWESTEVRVICKQSHQQSIPIGRDIDHTWNEAGVRSFIGGDSREQKPDGVAQTCDSIEVGINSDPQPNDLTTQGSG